MLGEKDAAEETLQDALGGEVGDVGEEALEGYDEKPAANAGLEWLRKWRRMFELTLNARPQVGWGQRNAGCGVSACFIE